MEPCALDPHRTSHQKSHLRGNLFHKTTNIVAFKFTKKLSIEKIIFASDNFTFFLAIPFNLLGLIWFSH